MLEHFFKNFKIHTNCVNVEVQTMTCILCQSLYIYSHSRMSSNVSYMPCSVVIILHHYSALCWQYSCHIHDSMIILGGLLADRLKSNINVFAFSEVFWFKPRLQINLIKLISLILHSVWCTVVVLCEKIPR